MKKLFLIFGNSLRRSKFIVFASLVCGLGLCVLYNGMTGLINTNYEGIPIGLMIREETPVTDDLRTYLADELGMELTESTDEDFMNSELVERRVAAVVEVPEGYAEALLAEEPLPLLVSFLDDYANAAFVQGYLEVYGASVATLALGANGDMATLTEMFGDLRENIAPVTTQSAQGDSLLEITRKEAFRTVMGFYMMLASLFLGFGVALAIYEDRKKGLYRRVKATNVIPGQYIAGNCLSGLVIALMMILPLIVFLMINQISLGIGVGQIFLICLLYSTFSVAFAMVAALYLQSRNAIVAALVGTSTIMNMLGGAYFPIDTAPDFLQKLARATPQFWTGEAVDTLMVDPSASWSMSAIIVALFALLCFILAGARFAEGGRKRR